MLVLYDKQDFKTGRADGYRVWIRLFDQDWGTMHEQQRFPLRLGLVVFSLFH